MTEKREVHLLTFPAEPFKRYANHAGNSGVTHYGVLEGGILVVAFKDGSAYAYAAPPAHTMHVRDMHRLAHEGKGLATYIAKHKPIGLKIDLIFGLEE